MIDRGYKAEHIVLHGFSMGTGSSTAAAAYFSRGKYKLGGLVLQSPFSSIRQVIRDVMSPWLAYAVPDRWNNEKAIKDVTYPILILHGSADANVPFVNYSERIQASNKNAKVINVKDTGHYLPVTLVSAEIKKWLQTKN
jgi:pimeloyl-ACP methyl ester carboxylesterase